MCPLRRLEAEYAAATDQPVPFDLGDIRASVGPAGLDGELRLLGDVATPLREPEELTHGRPLVLERHDGRNIRVESPG